MSNMPEKIWVSDPALNCKDGEICLAFDKECNGTEFTRSDLVVPKADIADDVRKLATADSSPAEDWLTLDEVVEIGQRLLSYIESDMSPQKSISKTICGADVVSFAERVQALRSDDPNIFVAILGITREAEHILSTLQDNSGGEG